MFINQLLMASIENKKLPCWNYKLFVVASLNWYRDSFENKKKCLNITQMRLSGTKGNWFITKPDVKEVLYRCPFKWLFRVVFANIQLLHSGIPSRSLVCRLEVVEQDGCCVPPPVDCCCCHYFRSCCFRAACFLKCWPAGLGKMRRNAGNFSRLKCKRKWVTNSAPNSVQIHRALLKILNDLYGKFVLYIIFFCLNFCKQALGKIVMP